MYDSDIAVGDKVSIQISRMDNHVKSVSVVNGTVVKADHSNLGFHGFIQYQLDTGIWFSPNADKILSHTKAGTPS